MLVVCNGSMKSGSTWIVDIIKAHGMWNKIPDEYRNEKWTNASIDQDKYESFLEHCDYENHHFYCKQHWSTQDKYLQLLDDRNIKVINIYRDLRDVLVSRYFHDLRLRITNSQNVIDYFKNGKGDIKLKEYIDFHVFWHANETIAQPHICNYENLQIKFENEVRKLFKFLGVEISDAEVSRLKNVTAFSKRKSTGEGKFFRKGIIGDWKNHLTDEISHEIYNMALENNYPFNVSGGNPPGENSLQKK